MDFLKAMVASLWSQKRRRWWHPDSTALFVRAGVVSGVIEAALFGYLEFMQFRAHFLAQAEYFSQGNESTQMTAVFVVAIAEFFYPVSLVYIVLAAEGFFRALGAAFVGEVLPSLPLVILERLWELVRPGKQAIFR